MAEQVRVPDLCRHQQRLDHAQAEAQAPIARVHHNVLNVSTFPAAPNKLQFDHKGGCGDDLLLI